MFGPLLFVNHNLPSTSRSMTDLMSDLGQNYFNFRKVQAKKTFLNKCMTNNVLPSGLKISLNLALGVNDSDLVCTIENILDLAFSRILETLVLFLEKEEEVLDNELVSLQILSTIFSALVTIPLIMLALVRI